GGGPRPGGDHAVLGGRGHGLDARAHGVVPLRPRAARCDTRRPGRDDSAHPPPHGHRKEDMRGIVSAAAYIPRARLDRTAIAGFVGSGGGKGTRSVASYDEDTTTMGVEAARLALRSAPAGASPDALWFASASPAYLDKNNASTLHAALRLDTDVSAFDFGGALRSGIGALRAALDGANSVLVVTSDLRGGLPTSGDESASGDGAGALLVGDDTDGPVIAEYLGGASATEEFLERWRTPGSTRS